MKKNMMKTALIVSLLYSNSSFAQFKKLPILIKGDFGSSNINSTYGKGSSQFCYGIGVETFVVVKQFTKERSLEINPNISLFHTSYGQSAALLARSPLSGDVKVNYITLSLPITYNISGLRSANDNGILIGVGPYFNIATSGNFETLSNGVYYKRQINFGNSTADNRKRNDAGITVKMGFKVNPKLYMGLQFNRGIQNTTPSARVVNGSFLKVNNSFFYASYLINKNRKK